MSKENAGVAVLSAGDRMNFRGRRGAFWGGLRGYVLCILLLKIFTTAAMAGEAPVNLGSAANFAALAGSTVTNVVSVGTTITGDIGVSPGTEVTGFPPGIVIGTIHAGDSVAALAQADLTTAYNDAAGRSTAPITESGNLGGMTLTPGLYKSTSSLAVSSGDLTLDAQGDPNAVFIFQMASTLTTTSGRKVILTGGAKASNIFWQVGSSATFGTGSVFKGTILAAISISFTTSATLDGSALAMSGAVTLDSNTIVATGVLNRGAPIITTVDTSITSSTLDVQWTNPHETPMVFLGLVYDLYLDEFLTFDEINSVFYPVPPTDTSTTLETVYTGGYDVWVANLYPDLSWYPSDPWTGIVYGGEPHPLLDVTVEDLGGGQARLHWRPEVYGTWLLEIIPNKAGEGFITVDGPCSVLYPTFAPWTFIDYGELAYDHAKASFFDGWADFTLPGPGEYWFFIRSLAWIPPYLPNDFAVGHIVVPQGAARRPG